MLFWDHRREASKQSLGVKNGDMNKIPGGIQNNIYKTKELIIQVGLKEPLKFN